jgi:hypothetical protein
MGTRCVVLRGAMGSSEPDESFTSTLAAFQRQRNWGPDVPNSVLINANWEGFSFRNAEI